MLLVGLFEESSVPHGGERLEQSQSSGRFVNSVFCSRRRVSLVKMSVILRVFRESLQKCCLLGGWRFARVVLNQTRGHGFPTE